MLIKLLQIWFLLPFVMRTANLMWFVYLFPLASLVGYAVPCGLPLLAALRKGKKGPGDGIIREFPLAYAVAACLASFLLVEAAGLLLWILSISFLSDRLPALLNLRLHALMEWTRPARLLLPFFLVSRRVGIRVRASGSFVRKGPLTPFALAGGLFLASLALGELAGRLGGGPPGPPGLTVDLVRFLPVGWLAYSFFITCIAVPISEELFFRGLLQTAYESVMGSSAALLCQALAFALIHDSIAPFMLARFFAHGLFLGIIRKKTGSLVPGMAYHIAWNALWFGLAVLRLR